VWHRLRGNYNLQGPQRPRGALILVHDATEALQTQRELESKMALVREVHHRVKNNLQVIAAIMRMQSRRVQSAEARLALEESVNRVLSVAVVHEFLSQNAQGTINLQEVAHRILSQMQQSLVNPYKRITLSVRGPAIWLPAERATQCALVINELVQNAIEHGLAEREEGSVEVELEDHGDGVEIHVLDHGQGLPKGFDLGTDANLGLRIVRSMVERDLRGQFELSSADGTRATVRFEKSVVGGG
jgi:two-component sensor histidine kinase